VSAFATSSSRRVVLAALFVPLLSTSCSKQDDKQGSVGASKTNTINAEPSGAPTFAGPLAPTAQVRFVTPPPTGDVAPIIKEELAQAQKENRRVLVYVGATWCDPCQRFHHAAAQGLLDKDFPNLTLVEFDADRDNPRLLAAGYGSQYIPLFALPRPDGRASGRHIQGSIKGDGAVAEITPRLKELLK
jgi:thiol-disulfide isomerase/thioredoxin